MKFSQLFGLLSLSGATVLAQLAPTAIVSPPAPAGSRQSPSAKLPILAAGVVAPDFVMRDINDQEVRLSDFKGKVVILDFWATWCGPCIASFPHTSAIATKYAEQGVVVLAAGTSDTIAAFKTWIPKNQPKYAAIRFAFDLNERNSATFDQRASQKLYHVEGIPTQFVIGRDGKIAGVIVGNEGDGDARTEFALAVAGVKVDDAIVAKGRGQVANAEAAAKANAAAALAEMQKTRQPFSESFGVLNAGDPVPEAEVAQLDGTIVKLSSLTQGKVSVLGFWGGGNGPGPQMVKEWNAWASAYPDVLFLGIGLFVATEDTAKWVRDAAGPLNFKMVADLAGTMPRPTKERDQMSEDDMRAFAMAQRDHFKKTLPNKLARTMPPNPALVVIDAEGKLIGMTAGFGPHQHEAVGNMLLRAGVKLAAADMPSKVWTREETKPAPDPKVEMLKVGAMAPDFSTEDLAGKEVKISTFKGKVVILDFWATWCGPCMAAMPHTQEIAAKYKDQGVVVLGSCTSDTRLKFEAWVKANQENYPDILWSHDRFERLPIRASHRLYGVQGIPTQFIIDRDGKVVDIVVGYQKGEAILDAALAKAGIKVDPALVEKGASDLRKRG
jgi:thiol-disulfide isomerase/thioredoxin